MLHGSLPLLSNDTGGAGLAAVGHNLSETFSRNDPASASGVSLGHGNASLSHPLNSTLHAASHREAVAAGAAIAIFYGVLVRLSMPPLPYEPDTSIRSHGCISLYTGPLESAVSPGSLPSNLLEYDKLEFDIFDIRSIYRTLKGRCPTSKR